MRKSIITQTIFIFLMSSFAFAQNLDSLLIPSSDIEIKNSPSTNTNSNYFNLANIVDSFLADNSKEEIQNEDKDSFVRKQFISTTTKFNQGNVSVAYDEYESLIRDIDNDTSLMALSKVLYELGFFSLAQKASDKIVLKNNFENINSDLKRSYLPKISLTKEQEIYFAKLYSSIYFDNSGLESVMELQDKKNEFSKNDFAQYTLSRAQFEQKHYKEALNAINRAIALNPYNTSYQMQKLDILIANQKYKDAKKLIEKLEKEYPIVFLSALNIKKQTVLANLCNNEKDKKYYAAKISYLEGNYEKVKKDCLNILNFDKENDKILSLYAKSELASGNIERANSYFVNSYKIEKNNPDTIIGLADIKYLHGDYKNSIKMYKKALAKDKDNYEIILKLASAQRQYAKNPKELKKMEIVLNNIPKNSHIAYYNAALSLAQKNSVLKEEFLKRSIEINPLFESAIGELIELNLKNKNYLNAKNLVYASAFTLEKNYYYYYLCGLYNQAVNKKKDAIRFYKTSIDLNPNFEAANTMLLKLIPNDVSEEI